MRRSYVNMSRDMGYYWLRLVIYIMLTVCIGSIYFKVGNEFSAIMVCSLFSMICELDVSHVLDWCICFRIVLTQFSSSSVSGKGRLHVLRRWILDIHVHRGVSIIRRRHEGKTSVARFIIVLVLHNFQLHGIHKEPRQAYNISIHVFGYL